MRLPRWSGRGRGAESCRALGMREEDVATVGDLVRKAQEGRRLVPQKTYRDYRFNQPVELGVPVELLLRAESDKCHSANLRLAVAVGVPIPVTLTAGGVA